MTVSERFLKYVSFGTTSSEESGTHPSNPDEFALAKYIAEELENLGLSQVKVDERCYLTAVLPATPGLENKPAVGLIAHLDTSCAVLHAGMFFYAL